MKKYIKEWKWIALGMISILAFGLLLRVYNLVSLPIFADEAIYIRWSQVMKSEPTLRFLPLSDGKQPLFMWIMIPFLKFISDPLIAGRIVSAFVGIGTLLGVFAASYLLFKNKKVALFGSLIYSIVPFSVFFDRMALADSMLTFFGIWVFTLGYLIVTTLRLDVAMICGFVLGGALLTKSPALYFSLLLPLFVVFVKNKRSIGKFMLLLIPTYVIAYGMYNILRLGPNFHMLALRNMDYVHPLNHIFIYPFDPLKPFLHRSWQYYLNMGTASLFVMFLLSYFLNTKSKLKEMFILSVWFIVPIVISSEFSKTMTARYVLFSLPFYILITSASFLAKSNWLEKSLVSLLVLYVFQSTIYNYKILTNPLTAELPRSERSGYLEEWTAGQGIREVSMHIADQAKDIAPDKNVIVGTEGFFGTLPDGLLIYFDKSTNVKVIGIGLELDKVPQSLLDAKKAGNKVFLTANDERINTDYEKLGLKKINSYQKGARPDGSMQSLILYEVTEKSIIQNLNYSYHFY